MPGVTSFGARAYMRALEARAAFFRRVSQEFDAVWLGVLSPRALDEFDAHFFAVTTEAYAGRNARYTEDRWNARGLFDWEAAVIAEHLPPPRRVVVTSAGAGREVLALLEGGYETTGYEPNADLVAAGGRLLAARGHAGRLRLSSRDAFPSGAPQCDAVIVGWGSYTNMRPRATRIAFLRGVHAHLGPGGRALVSFHARGENDEMHARIAAHAAVVRRLLRRPPPELGDAMAPNFVHRFTLPEAIDEFREAGFDVVFASAQPYGHAVLEKPAL